MVQRYQGVFQGLADGCRSAISLISGSLITGCNSLYSVVVSKAIVTGVGRSVMILIVNCGHMARLRSI